MSIPILSREDVVYKKEEDPINTELGLSESIAEDDKATEEDDKATEEDGSQKAEESQETVVNGGEKVDDIRRKIIDFIKSQGYAYAEGEREFDDETNDMFTKGGTLVELAITIGIDNKVIKEIVEEAN